MSNLYHEDIYKFKEPVKSYWETTTDTKNKYNKLEKNIQTNIKIWKRRNKEIFQKYHRGFKFYKKFNRRIQN